MTEYVFMGFLNKLPLFLVFLTFNFILPASTKSDQCAAAAEVKTFGSNGSDGANGKDGQNGQNIDSITVFADGSPMNLNLSGQNGRNGEAGGNAGDPNCSSQPLSVNYNLRAPDGGNGGNGGSGGDGGNAGSVTIYTTNPANLKSITVMAVGGQGGQPGQGGMGTKGCNCSEPYWNIQTCTGNPGDPNYSCTTQEFRCQNGQNGVNGSSGRLGRDGLPGKLTLINLNKPLEADRPTASVSLSKLKEVGFVLSKNQWETRNGAVALLSPGSVIDNQYLALLERVERSFFLIWNAPQSFSKFADRIVTLSLKDNQEIEDSLPKDVWLEATTQQQNNRTELIVNNAILESEATQLEIQSLSGNGNDLQLTVVDKANLSNLVATNFKIKYQITRSDPRFRPPSDLTTKYEGEIPPELVSRNGDRFTINLGKLPIDSEAFRSGLGVEINLVANRSFAGYSSQKEMNFKDVIGPFK